MFKQNALNVMPENEQVGGGEEISFQVLIRTFVWCSRKKRVHTCVVWICLNYFVISIFRITVLAFVVS